MKREALVDAIAIAIGLGLSEDTGYLPPLDMLNLSATYMKTFVEEYHDAAVRVVAVPAIAALIDEMEPS